MGKVRGGKAGKSKVAYGKASAGGKKTFEENPCWHTDTL